MSSFLTGLVDVAVYLRKSRADLEAEARGEGETLSKHRKALLELARKHQYAITDVFEEIVSGERILDRPQMQKLLHGIEEGKYSAVLCMDIDRLGRGNMIDQGMIQEAFKESQTLIITPRKVYDLQDEMDEEWSEFESFMGRRELKIIKRRLQRGRRASAAEGRFIGRKPPYGYLKDDEKRLYPDPNTADVVRQIFDLYANGNGIMRIARILQDIGCPPPENHKGPNRWTYSTVNDILRNEVYLGRLIFGQYRHFKKDGHRKKQLLPREQWVIVENAHEPLISHDVWNQCQFNRSLNQPRTPIDYTLQNPLSGIVRCGHCGRLMRRSPGNRGRKPRLLCHHKTCVCASSKFDEVETVILEHLSELAERSPKPTFEDDTETSTGQRREMLLKRMQRIDAELAEKDAQLSNMHRLVELGAYDVDTFINRSREVNNEKKSLEAERLQTQTEIDGFDEVAARRSRLLPGLANVVKEYRATESVERKNHILKAVVEDTVYYKQKGLDKGFTLEITLRI